MSFCTRNGKDRIVFVTKEHYEQPCSLDIVANDDGYLDDDRDEAQAAGPYLPNGEYNWDFFDCPCTGHLPSGPCGPQFRMFLQTCTKNPGTKTVNQDDCAEANSQFRNCLEKYPQLYGDFLKDNDKESENESDMVETSDSTDGINSQETLDSQEAPVNTVVDTNQTPS